MAFFISIVSSMPPLVGAQFVCRAQSPVDSLEARAKATVSSIQGRLKVPGLTKPVEVLRDRWGVAHIYARNQHDLFFAQGFVAAQDRLFQLDLWRRSVQGRLSEVLGPNFIERDAMTPPGVQLDFPLRSMPKTYIDANSNFTFDPGEKAPAQIELAPPHGPIKPGIDGERAAIMRKAR